MANATFIMKNHHQGERRHFCIYDADYNFIEEIECSASDAAELGLKFVSPIEMHNRCVGRA